MNKMSLAGLESLKIQLDVQRSTPTAALWDTEKIGVSAEQIESILNVPESQDMITSILYVSWKLRT